MNRLFHYLSPKIYPVFPEAAGTLVFGLFPQHVIDTRAGKRHTGTMTVRCTAWCEGKTTWEQEHKIQIRDGICEREAIWHRLTLLALGYAEVAITCDDAVFYRINRDPGYAMVVAPDGRRLTVNPDSKYANHFVVEQFRAWQTFCMFHSAVLVDRARGIGNGFHFINPYDQKIVVRLVSSVGRSARCVVPSRHARMFDLEPLLEQGRIGTVMLTANNRIGVYDVRHPYGAPETPTSIDHLDVYSGIGTHLKTSPGGFARHAVRRALRQVGQRYV